METEASIPIKRKWRVGTCSMGLLLVALGVTLFASERQGLAAFDTLLQWWPIIFVLLGVEVLLHLFIGGKRNTIVYYDILSIVFVILLCTVALGITALTSTGLLAEIRYEVAAREVTVDLKSIEAPIPAEIQKIIIQGDGNAHVDLSEGRTVSFFGNYREVTAIDGKELTAGADHALDVLDINTVGSTMYVTINPLPIKRGMNSYHPRMNATLVLPADLPLEFRGAMSHNSPTALAN